MTTASRQRGRRLTISHGSRCRFERRAAPTDSRTNCHTAKPTNAIPPAATNHFSFSSISSFAFCRAATAAGGCSCWLRSVLIVQEGGLRTDVPSTHPLSCLRSADPCQGDPRATKMPIEFLIQPLENSISTGRASSRLTTPSKDQSRCLDAGGNDQLRGACAFFDTSLRVTLQPGVLPAIPKR